MNLFKQNILFSFREQPIEQVLKLFDIRSNEGICEIGNKGECPDNGEVCCENIKKVTVDPASTDCSDYEDYHCVGIHVSFEVIVKLMYVPLKPTLKFN